MAEKRYVADLWKARPICGGGGMMKAEQQNGTVMATLNGDGRGVAEKKGRKKKNKRNGDDGLFSYEGCAFFLKC